jgi:hypothetical protein
MHCIKGELLITAYHENTHYLPTLVFSTHGMWIEKVDYRH